MCPCHTCTRTRTPFTRALQNTEAVMPHDCFFGGIVHVYITRGRRWTKTPRLRLLSRVCTPAVLTFLPSPERTFRSLRNPSSSLPSPPPHEYSVRYTIGSPAQGTVVRSGLETLCVGTNVTHRAVPKGLPTRIAKQHPRPPSPSRLVSSGVPSRDARVYGHKTTAMHNN